MSPLSSLKLHLVRRPAATAALFVSACLLPACMADIDEEEQDEPVEVPADENVEEATQELFGSDACKDTELFIGNLRERNGVGTAIKITKLEYYSATDATWRTENVPNEELPFEMGITYYNRDLEHAEHDNITKWRVYYKYAVGSGWSSLVYQTDDTPNQICHDDDDFDMYVN